MPLIVLLFALLAASCTENAKVGECYVHHAYHGLPVEYISSFYAGAVVAVNDHYTVVKTLNGDMQYLMLNTALGIGQDRWLPTHCKNLGLTR